MKYKFEETQGCLAFGFTVNGEDINNISKEEQKLIIDYLCERMKEKLDEDTLYLNDIVKTFSPTDYGYEKERCDTCGDTVSWEIWEL